MTTNNSEARKETRDAVETAIELSKDWKHTWAELLKKAPLRSGATWQPKEGSSASSSCSRKDSTK